MDPSLSNFYFSVGDSGDYQNNQYSENTQFYSNPTQDHVTENFQTSRNTEKLSRGTKWEVAEDVALMSSWCQVSEDKIRGKNQKTLARWAQVKKLYDEARAENPEKLGERNIEQMKGRFSRLNLSVQKWVGAYKEAYRRIKSGKNMKDVEADAHMIYEQDVKSKFTDSVVFNEVMCKHSRWELNLGRDTTRSRPDREAENEESGGSTKRTRTTDEGDYSNPETPNTGCSTIQRPIGRDAAKRKGKDKASIAEQLHALKLAKDTENELFKRKLDLEPEKARQKEERDLKRMQVMHLNTLLGKEHLSAYEEDLKNELLLKFYGKRN